jgi:hypothetical protein
MCYEQAKKDIVKTAKKMADKSVPKAVDVSILGGGFSFLLEFSTVMVIIFAVVILGIIGILGGNESAAILAAISGYVLGKATLSISSSKEQTTPQTQDTEKQNKLIENQNKKIDELLEYFEELKKQATPAQPPPPPKKP